MALELAVRSRSRARSLRRAGRRAIGLTALLVLVFALPPAFGLTRCTVSDDAMSGDLGQGAVVYTESLRVSDLEIGDVITFADPTSDGRERLIARRILDIRTGQIWTSGDRTGEVDPWTLTFKEAARARTVVNVPYVGYFLDTVADGSKSVWQTIVGPG